MNSAVSSIGPTRAQHLGVLTNQIGQIPNGSEAALETLVIAQLAAIRKRETELRDRLQSAAGIETVNVAAEVWQLQSSADRLNRMIDAMNLDGPLASFSV